MNAIILTRQYEGMDVFFNEKAWIHATPIAAREGKDMKDFIRLPSTEEYIQELIEDAKSKGGKIPPLKSDFIITKRGKYGGTWLHPELALLFARWISAKFTLWCDRQLRQMRADMVKSPKEIEDEIVRRIARGDGIALRKEETKRIRVFAEYLGIYQDRKASSALFAEVTRITNNALGLSSGMRDHVDATTLDNIKMLERITICAIEEGIAAKASRSQIMSEIYRRVELAARMVRPVPAYGNLIK